VKIRANTKRVKGKLRWYVTASYRDDAGKPRTKWLVYLGEPPNFWLKKAIERVNKHPEPWFIWANGKEQVKKYVRDLRKLRKWQRNQRIPRLKRRRDLYAAHKAGMPIRPRCPIAKNPKDPLSEIRRLFWFDCQALELLKANVKNLQFRNLPEHQKQELRLKYAPLLKALDARRAMWEEIANGKLASMSVRRPVQLVKKTQEESEREEVDDPGVLKVEMMKHLDLREAKILQDRFSLEDETVKKTLAELGREFGITREGVRQIQKRALQKLRHFCRSTYFPKTMPAV
jgi:hypothetical protein